jgi:hypothetical protein
VSLCCGAAVLRLSDEVDDIEWTLQPIGTSGDPCD